MSGEDPAEFPKPSDKDQLQVAKEDNLDGAQVALVDSCLPRGSLPTNNFDDASATALMIRQCLHMVEQLKEDQKQTDELIDQVLVQATEINRELILRNQMIRKRRLLRELETQYMGSMHVLVETIRMEFDSI